MKSIPFFLQLAAFLGSGLYLKSPSIVACAVALWAITSAEAVLMRRNRDAEIVGLIRRMDALQKDHALLSQDILNVAERAKTILGEHY